MRAKTILLERRLAAQQETMKQSKQVGEWEQIDHENEGALRL